MPFAISFLEDLVSAVQRRLAHGGDRSKLSRDQHHSVPSARCGMSARSMEGDTSVPSSYSQFFIPHRNASRHCRLIPPPRSSDLLRSTLRRLSLQLCHAHDALVPFSRDPLSNSAVAAKGRSKNKTLFWWGGTVAHYVINGYGDLLARQRMKIAHLCQHRTSPPPLTNIDHHCISSEDKTETPLIAPILNVPVICSAPGTSILEMEKGSFYCTSQWAAHFSNKCIRGERLMFRSIWCIKIHVLQRCNSHIKVVRLSLCTKGFLTWNTHTLSL